MSLRLILMRHAKSDWDSPASGDFDRPLNKRGRRAATAIGRWLRAHGHIPDATLCSAAARTKETWSRVENQLDTKPRLKLLRTLYLASPDVMFQEIINAKDAPTLLMLAHNPGSSILASALADWSPAHARFDDYPTAATTIFEFDAAQWGSIKPGSGQVIDFVVPHDLMEHR